MSGGSFSPFHGVKTIEKYQAGDVKNATSNLNVLMEQKQRLWGTLWSVVHDDLGRDSDLGELRRRAGQHEQRCWELC